MMEEKRGFFFCSGSSSERGENGDPFWICSRRRERAIDGGGLMDEDRIYRMGDFWER